MKFETDLGPLEVDEDRYGTAAQRMVQEQLIAWEISDVRVLRRMRRVPRHLFVADSLGDRAYDDAAQPTLHGQTISQPYMVAAMTAALDVHAEHHVLEIGTGSGYQTMILARLGRSVVSVERDADLAAGARAVLERLGVKNVTIHVGDGSRGWAESGPYDRIIVTAGSPQVPGPVSEQLKVGGRLVIPVGGRGVQQLMQVDKEAVGERRSVLMDCRFVPLVGQFGWEDD